jgi:hypothetical protein
MNIEKLVQIKLVNGEELIACYENFGDGGDEVSITYALSMSPLEFEYEETIDLDQTKSYYVLRPSHIPMTSRTTLVSIPTPSLP